MITSLTIRGLGPHVKTGLAMDPQQPSTLVGASESGKTTVIHALCWLLWGTDADGNALAVDHIHDGESAVEVRGTTVRGTTFVRRMTRSRSTTRTMTPPGGDPLKVKTEAEWSEHLGRAGDAELGRAVLTPDTWLGLAQGAGGGRPLRDLLSRVLPGPTSEELLAEGGVPEALRSEKAATDHRREAKRKADFEAGALESTRKQLEDAQSDDDLAGLVDDDGVARARQQVSAHADQVKRYREASDRHAAWQRAHDQHAAALATHQRWTSRLALVVEPDAPRPSPTDLADAETACAKTAEAATIAERVLNAPAEDAALARAVADARARVDRAEAALADLPESPACASLPGCTLAASAGQEKARRETEVEEARTALAEAEQALASDRKTREAERREATAGLDELRRGADEARKRLETVRRADQAWRTYDASKAALGSEPEVPEDPGPAPELPDAPSEPTQALELVRQAEATRARAKAAAERVERLQAQVAEQEAVAKAARQAADNAERIVSLVRSAPGRALRQKLDALQISGTGVALHVPEEGAAIEVNIDGRPWWLASTGRRISASAAFRHALRVATGIPWMPIAVDNAQAWSGRLDVPAPCLLLLTSDTPLAIEEAA